MVDTCWYQQFPNGDLGMVDPIATSQFFEDSSSEGSSTSSDPHSSRSNAVTGT